MTVAAGSDPPHVATRGSASERSVPHPARDPKPNRSPARKAALVLTALDQTLAARLLAHLDRAAVEAVTLEIAQLGPVDPAERKAALEEFHTLGLRRLRFAFDDLARMNEAVVQTAFHDDDLRVWALALAGAAAGLRSKVMHALGPGRAHVLGRALENLGPFRLSDSEAAQQEIAELLRELHDRGRINLPEPDSREEVVV